VLLVLASFVNNATGESVLILVWWYEAVKGCEVRLNWHRLAGVCCRSRRFIRCGRAGLRRREAIVVFCARLSSASDLGLSDKQSSRAGKVGVTSEPGLKQDSLQNHGRSIPNSQGD
jgi:hypothetical protein